MGYIDCRKMAEVIEQTPKSSYREYLLRVYHESELCGQLGGVA
jgi:glucose-1-phosphate thymidylyltransferase